MSYTGSLLSRKRYLPMSVSAAAESIASLPTRFLSKYGVASRPCVQSTFQLIHAQGRRSGASKTISLEFRADRSLSSLTREIIIPAILMRIFGPLSNLYLRSTPFQKDTKYLFICTLSPPCNLEPWNGKM